MSIALSFMASKIIAGLDSSTDRDLFPKVLRKYRTQVEQAQVEQAQVEQARRPHNPMHYIMNGAPACRPRSGHFWALLGEHDFAAWEGLPEGYRCQACERSKRVAFMRKQHAKS